MTGNGLNILNGSGNSPQLNNGTDLGDVVLTSSTQATFTIENTWSGGSPKGNKLTITDITITGTNANDFVISGISLPKDINRSNSSTFNIIFSPSSLGVKIATITIINNDGDENPYVFQVSGNGIEAGNEPSLILTNTYPIGVLEPSGLAYNATNDELFTVSDNTGMVYKLSTTGSILQTLSYAGADLEGVSMYTSNKLLVAVEGSRELIEYDYVNDTFIASHVMNYSTTDLSTTGDNSRIEGVTYDAQNDAIYFLNEKNPGGLIKADGNFNVVNEYPLSYAGDYSAAHYVKETGLLWLASDQESTIYKCNTDGTVIDTFPVTTSGGGTINKLEGITIDHANQLLYAVSDGGQELYVFAINDPNTSQTAITAVQDSFSVLDGINGETTLTSVLDNDTFNELPATLAEVSLASISVLDEASNPTSDIALNADGTITVLSNTSTGDYSLTYEICELADLGNCSQVTNTISIQGTIPTVILAVEDVYPTLDGVNGETSVVSVLNNDTLDGLPVTLAEVNLSLISIVDESSNPTSNLLLNGDGTITVLSGTATGNYSLIYEICELADLGNCAQIANTISVVGPAPSNLDVITSGDVWKYYDNGNAPSGSWKSTGFDDSTWSSGNATLGYNNGESTSINASITTAYFRKAVQITNASSINTIDLSAIRDDGMIVYINGNEVWRDNMPTGAVSYSTQASAYIKDGDEITWINQSISNSLNEGTNVIAVEIHSKAPKGKNKTPDMSFDFAMTTNSGPSARGVSNSDISTNQKTETKSLANDTTFKEVVLYPVPTYSELRIALPGREKLQGVKIINIIGKVELIDNSSTIDVSNLNAGVYLVEIITDKNIYDKRIIIKK